MITHDRAADAYAEIAVNRAEILEGAGDDIALRSLFLRGEDKVPFGLTAQERSKALDADGMFLYVHRSMMPTHEWWKTPDGKSVLLSTRRIERILDGEDDGMPTDTSHLRFMQWTECHEPIEPDPEDDWAEWCTREHVMVNGKPGHFGPAPCGAQIVQVEGGSEIANAFMVEMSMLAFPCNLDSGHDGEHRSRGLTELARESADSFLGSLQAIAESVTTEIVERDGLVIEETTFPDPYQEESQMNEQPVQYPIEDIETEGLVKVDVPIPSTWPDGSPRVRIEADEPDPEDPRKPLDAAQPVKDLADGVERVSGFLEALHDPSLGHKAIAEMFPFTSETSVRRWRKANGVVLG